MTRGEGTRGIEDDGVRDGRQKEREGKSEKGKRERETKESARVTMYAGGLLQGERWRQREGKRKTEKEKER